MQRRLMVAGRLTLFASSFPPAWVAGTAMLAVGKILENMEIGHNVMHGQWDWMNDPEIHSGTWEWDTTCPAEQWKHSHNFVHHTFTNVIGKDNDVGYGILRVTSDQKWHPVQLRPARLQRPAGAAVRVGRGAARPRHRGHPQATRRIPTS